MTRRFPSLLCALGLVAGGCKPVTFFDQTNLTADRAGQAEHVDPDLVNPWGLAFGPDSYFWVANNGTSTATLYTTTGLSASSSIGGPLELVDDQGNALAPTGMVFNDSDGFLITVGEGEDQTQAPAEFLVATENGMILAWTADIDMRKVFVMADASEDGANYQGLAIAADSTGITRLYAADFARGMIVVLGDDFLPAMDMAESAFDDPGVPEGYAPFGIQEVGGLIYVAWALPNETRTEPVKGGGLGYVDVFDTAGLLVDTVSMGDELDAPWAIARAPSDFGEMSSTLLIGNFGDGRIHAYDAFTYELLDPLMSARRTEIQIDGLWDLKVGNGMRAGDTDALYFTAGPDEETHGLFGALTAR